MSNLLLNMITAAPTGGEPNNVPLTQYINFSLASSQHITFPDVPTLSALTPMTAMIYTNANGTTEDFIKGFFTHSNATGDNRAWRMVAHPTNAEAFGVFLNEDGDPSPLKQYTTPSVFTGSWKQIVFTFAPNDLKLYVDGAHIASPGLVNDDVVNSIYDSTAPIEVGSLNAGTGGFFTGGVTQAAMWDRVLSAAEIAAIYAAFNPGPSGTTMNLKKDQGSYSGAPDLKFWARLGNGDTIAASGIIDSSETENHGTPFNTPVISSF